MSTDSKGPKIAFGLFTLLVGVGISYLMYTHPEGINPEWPKALAFLAPSLFILGGVLIIADTLQLTRLAIVSIRAMLAVLWAIVHWAAFFTTHIQCRGAVSFLGAEIVRWYPSEAECRFSLRILIGSLDVLVLVAVGVFAWQRYQERRKTTSASSP